MATYRVAVNMEFVRSADKGFEEGVEIASELGYRWIEPMVHTGWELLSEVHYFHSFSMEEDPLLMQRDLRPPRRRRLEPQRPQPADEAGGGRAAADAGDRPRGRRRGALRQHRRDGEAGLDGRRAGARGDALHAHEGGPRRGPSRRLRLRRAARHLHEDVRGPAPDRRARPSPWIQVNWDTGNAYLAGIEDPYEALERCVDRVFHVHAKDISIEHGERERGKVTGTPVGCACGEGVVDWERVLHILDPLDREITLSVECGTIDEAERSRVFLDNLIGVHA